MRCEWRAMRDDSALAVGTMTMAIRQLAPTAAPTRGSAPWAQARGVAHRASLGLLAVLVGLAGVAVPSLANAQTALATPGTEAGAADPERVLRRYCVSCHNGRLRTAGLALDEVDPAHPGDAVDVWEKVVLKLPRADTLYGPRTKKRIRDMPGYTEICRDIVGYSGMGPRRLRPMIVGVPPRVGAAYAGIGRRNCGSRLLIHQMAFKPRFPGVLGSLK